LPHPNPEEACVMNRSSLRVAIAGLTLVTAVIHLYLNFNTGTFQFQPMFTLNGLGYLALLGALFLNLPFLAGRERLVHYAFIGYTVVTILAWVAFGERSLIGYTDKVVEVLLVAALWLHLRQPA
jgi:hypothetical protein